MESKTVLVTGGTGFIGRPLCLKLQELGFCIYVLTRKKNLHSSKQSRGIIYIHSWESLNNVVIDIIINLSGETIAQRWTKQTKVNIYDSRIQTTRQIIEYIRSQPEKPTLLISASGVGVYGTDREKTFTEETSLSPVASCFSQELCKSWEYEARKAEAFGVRVVLLRIGPVLEKDGGILSKLFLSFYMGLGSTIGRGEQAFSWIDRDDLIDLILFVMAHPKITGDLNATAPEPVTYKKFAKTLANTLRRPCFLSIPDFVFLGVFGQMAKEIMLEGQKVLPQKALLNGFKFQYVSLEKSLQKIFQ